MAADKNLLASNTNRAIAVLALLFLYLPIVTLVVLSFNANDITTIWSGFSVKWYADVMGNEAILRAARNSLVVATVATLLATAAATAAALGVARSTHGHRTAVEGWVDAVVTAAAADRLPNIAKLQEALRRRRAAGGPAEKTFATLVGWELRPRRLREAAARWAALAESRGQEGRDQVWAHPDLLPTTEDLQHPEAFVVSSDPQSAVSLDAELEALGDTGDAPEPPSDAQLPPDDEPHPSGN